MHWWRCVLMTTVIRTRIGQGTLVHIVPMGSGQPFLVGHTPLNLCCGAKDRTPHHQAASLIMTAHKCESILASPPALRNRTAHRDTHNCTAQLQSIHTHKRKRIGLAPTPTRSEPLCHLGFIPRPPIHTLPSPPILTPTERIPGACFARSATLPTHALTLSVPENSGKCFFSFFCLLSSSPLYSHLLQKAVNHWLTHWSTSRALVF